MKMLVWPTENGGVGTYHPNYATVLPGDTEESFLARKLARLREASAHVRTDGQIVNAYLASGGEVFLVDVADLPDGGYRAAWIWKGGKVEVDMDKARVIHAGKMRKEERIAAERAERARVRALPLAPAVVAAVTTAQLRAVKGDLK